MTGKENREQKRIMSIFLKSLRNLLFCFIRDMKKLYNIQDFAKGRRRYCMFHIAVCDDLQRDREEICLVLKEELEAFGI